MSAILNCKFRPPFYTVYSPGIIVYRPSSFPSLCCMVSSSRNHPGNCRTCVFLGFTLQLCNFSIQKRFAPDVMYTHARVSRLGVIGFFLSRLRHVTPPVWSVISTRRHSWPTERAAAPLFLSLSRSLSFSRMGLV